VDETYLEMAVERTRAVTVVTLPERGAARMKKATLAERRLRRTSNG
jgi:hypothetical protein